jgi:hypothetical protein
MFENTLAAIRQIKESLEEALDNGVSAKEYRKGLSSNDERLAFDEIQGHMEEISEILSDMYDFN